MNPNPNQIADGTQEIAHLVTQKTRHKIILDILAHPEQAPSLDELTYVSSSSKSTISEHLDKLVQYGFVEKLVIPEGSRNRSLPHIFFRVSDYGQSFLAMHNLVPVDDRELQEQYSKVSKSDRIVKYEDAPRYYAVRDLDGVDQAKNECLVRAVEGFDHEVDPPVGSSPQDDMPSDEDEFRIGDFVDLMGRVAGTFLESRGGQRGNGEQENGSSEKTPSFLKP